MLDFYCIMIIVAINYLNINHQCYLMNDNNDKIALQETDIEDIKRQLIWQLKYGSQYEIPPEKRDLISALGLLDTAEEDLRASKILYHKKLYAQSIFFLQQSVEKLGKSLLLLTGLCQTERLIKVGHTFTKFFFEKLKDLYESLADYSNDNQREGFLSIIEAIDKYLSDYEQKRKSEETLYLEHTTLKEILIKYNKLFSLFRKGIKSIRKENFDKIVKEEFISITDYVIQTIEQEYNIKLQTDERRMLREEFITQIQKEDWLVQIESYLYLILLFAYIVILSMNLEKHVGASRYPNYHSDYKYTKNHSIMRLYPIMLKTMREMIKTYDILLELCIVENNEKNKCERA